MDCFGCKLNKFNIYIIKINSSFLCDSRFTNRFQFFILKDTPVLALLMTKGLFNDWHVTGLKLGALRIDVKNICSLNSD